MNSIEERLLLLSLAGYVATCKKNNQHDWMDELANRINEVCEKTNDGCRVHYDVRNGIIKMEKII